MSLSQGAASVAAWRLDGGTVAILITGAATQEGAWPMCGEAMAKQSEGMHSRERLVRLLGRAASRTTLA